MQTSDASGESPEPEQTGTPPERRGFLTQTNSLLMGAGLAAGYGMFAYMAGRFLYPERSKTKTWVFVCTTRSIGDGASVLFQTPTGEKVNVARVAEGDEEKSFVALSSTCPHLGCQVHWEPQKNRFFCPCHNGIFDASGKATGGPPAEANQQLQHKPLKVQDGLIYMLVETRKIADAGVIEQPEYPRGSGHDPCLAPQPKRDEEPRDC